MTEIRQSFFENKLQDHFYTWLVDSEYKDPRHVFTLKEGVLRISGKGLGYLATKRKFSNYHLSLQFKWGNKNWQWGDRIGKARDSGLFLHAQGPDGNSHDGNGAFMAAIECNIFEGAVGDFLLIRGDDSEGHLIAPKITTEAAASKDAEDWPFFKIGGEQIRLERWGRVNHRFKSPEWRDITGFRTPEDLVIADAWNQLECRCVGDQILIFLNQTLVNKAQRVWPNSGRILLQCEGSEIFYRRMEIRLLE